MESVIDGQRILLDDEDGHWLAAYSWHVRSVSKSDGNLRVVAYTREAGKFRTVLLHRELLGRPTGGFVIFANGNQFDLRRGNLILSPKPVNFLPCPFTTDRLHELYWVEYQSIETLGGLAAATIGHPHPICTDTILRWLSEAGLRVRTHSEGMRVRHRSGGEAFEEWRLRGVRTHADNVRAGRTIPRVDHLHTKVMKRMARRRRAELKGGIK